MCFFAQNQLCAILCTLVVSSFRIHVVDKDLVGVIELRTSGSITTEGNVVRVNDGRPSFTSFFSSLVLEESKSIETSKASSVFRGS